MTGAPGQWAGYSDAGEPRRSPENGRDSAGPTAGLWAAVVVLGLISVGVGFWSPVPLDWAVRLPAAAAIVAAVGLLPKQLSRGWLVVVLATVGFIDAVTLLVADADNGWPLVVVLVVNALQAVVAVLALLVETRALAADEDGDHGEGDTEAADGPVDRPYAAGYVTPPPFDVTGRGGSGGPGSARVRAPRAAGALADAAQESYAAMQNAPARHDQRATATPRDSRASTSSPTDPGLPGAYPGGAAAPQSVRPGDVRGESPPRWKDE